MNDVDLPSLTEIRCLQITCECIHIHGVESTSLTFSLQDFALSLHKYRETDAKPKRLKDEVELKLWVDVRRKFKSWSWDLSLFSQQQCMSSARVDFWFFSKYQVELLVIVGVALLHTQSSFFSGNNNAKTEKLKRNLISSLHTHTYLHKWFELLKS